MAVTKGVNDVTGTSRTRTTTTRSVSNPGEIAVRNRPRTTTTSSPSPRNPGDIAASYTPSYTPPPPPPPPDLPQTSATDSAAAAPTEAEQAEMTALREKALATQLDAIAANYGMTKEQLLNDQTHIGEQFRLAAAGLMRQFDRAERAMLEDQAGRGVLRSGRTAYNTRMLNEQEAEQRAQMVLDRDTRLAQIAASLAALAPQEAADVAAAKEASARTKLDLETMRALYAG